MNNYEKIKKLVPVFYHDVAEMDAIYRVDGQILDKIDEDMARVEKNLFIMTADEETIADLEAFLRLRSSSQKKLDERRRLVASYFIGFGKMSKTKIKEILRAFTNADSEVSLSPINPEGDHALFIGMQRGTTDTLNVEDIEKILKDRLPGHIMTVCKVIYNQSNLSKFTHTELSKFTHAELKDGIPLKEVK